ncbi:hypothetical protein GGI02_005180 [Coemansia sp. RSA 2322]|uniref:Programmed cell death protein 5 n=1 Tax=Coemansia thaxteri TaxID=2663907 RepID=A0A9W8EGN5_9FUNG|nr:hypothetical protein H4R26_005929 [Coemansia thaxteri]KAJ2463703.1 hypothetical protein GGI02_005180 [Coemansia sp. RSA 2322]
MDGADLDAIKAQLSAGDAKETATGQQGNNDEERKAMLAQILSPEALGRLGHIALVKKERARAVEDMLMRMARMGQIRSKVKEEELVDMLKQINSSHHEETKIVYNRKGFEDSEDEEEYNFD